MYDTAIKSGQDTDLWIRIGLEYPIAFSTKSCAVYTSATDSLYKSIKSVEDRPDFEKFVSQEKENPALKRFLDINRFSLVIRAMLWNESEKSHLFRKRINPKSLNKKQQFLLKQPAWILKLLYKVKHILERKGIRLGVFG